MRSDLSPDVGESLEQCCGFFWGQKSFTLTNQSRFIFRSSLGLVHTGVEGLYLTGAQSLIEVVLLPTGHHQRHLCDTCGLSSVRPAVGHGILQGERPLGSEHGFVPLSAHQPTHLLMDIYRGAGHFRDR